MSNSQRPSQRKHVSSACACCRGSKIKCDGAFPTCSTCRTKGRECQYYADDDKRKLTNRMAVEILVNRIDELSRFIRQFALEPPILSQDAHASLTKVLSHLRLSDTIICKSGFQTSSLAMSSGSNADVSRPHNGLNGDGVPRGLSSEEPPEAGTAQSSLMSHYVNLSVNERVSDSPEDGGDASASKSPIGVFHELELDLPSEEMDQFPALDPALFQSAPSQDPRRDSVSTDNTGDIILIKELADRIGSLRIGPGGQVRYYGPTSNFNLVDMGAPDNLTVHRSVREHGPDYLCRLDMGKEVPAELEDHLVNLYFAWQDPALHVVKRSTYERAILASRTRNEESPYFSESLQNAICALGAAFEARHYSTFATFPKSLADFFADRAKTLLEIELDSPSLATVQTLVILSGHDIGCKRDSRGWLYSGMAIRLAFHLALHLDVSSYVTSKSITQDEADLRRDVFWAAYTVDHIWSFHLGRAVLINMETVTVRPPHADESADPVGQWVPYNCSKLIGRPTGIPDHTVSLHRQRVLLCEIMGPLGVTLYGNSKVMPSALHELNITTVKKLWQWKTELPVALQVNIDKPDALVLPQVLLLHMLYYQNIIYAHRPWMCSRDNDPAQPYLNEGHDPQHAKSMCIDAATSIAKLLRIYESLYGLRMINIQAVGITCSAALLLIFAVVIESSSINNSNGPSTATRSSFSSTGSGRPSISTPSTAALHLGTCFRALDEFGAAWESSKQAKDFLLLLQRRWDSHARKIREVKRKGSRSSDLNGRHLGDGVPVKRSRMVQDSTGLDIGHLKPWSGPTGDFPDLDGFGVTNDLDWILMGSCETGLGVDEML